MQGTPRAARRCLGFVCVIGAVGACTTAVSPPRGAVDERALAAMPDSPPLVANIDNSGGEAPGAMAAPAETGATREARGDADLPWLSPRHIGAAVRAHYSDFQACQALGDLESQREDGTVTVGWAVRANGSVNGVTLGASTFSSDGINSCVLSVAQQVTFPASPAPTQVSWTVKFRGAAPAPLADATLR